MRFSLVESSDPGIDSKGLGGVSPSGGLRGSLVLLNLLPRQYFQFVGAGFRRFGSEANVGGPTTASKRPGPKVHINSTAKQPNRKRAT